MIKAPNVAHMFISIEQIFSGIGPPKIWPLCPPYWISKWPLPPTGNWLHFWIWVNYRRENTEICG